MVTYYSNGAIWYGDTNGVLKHTGKKQEVAVIGNDNTLFGDATYQMIKNAKGGNDTLFAEGDSNKLYGDAGGTYQDDGGMYDHAKGGNDTLTVNGNSNWLIGDAYRMFDKNKGGNDIFTCSWGY